ncbi:hypothetical protein [Erwinia amylovora]
MPDPVSYTHLDVYKRQAFSRRQGAKPYRRADQRAGLMPVDLLKFVQSHCFAFRGKIQCLTLSLIHI